MSGIVAENGKVVTDGMIASWESALDADKWPSGWENVGDVVEGRLPTPLSDSVTLSVKIPAPMKRVIEHEAESHGLTTSAYVRGVLADALMTTA